MADTLALTTVTPLRPWNSTALDVFQSPTDYADFRFTLGSGTKRTVLRLMANYDVRLYGEVILDNGAFRSPQTFSFSSSNATKLASFRTGTGVGDEVFGFDTDGALTITAQSPTAAEVVLDATVEASSQRWALQSSAVSGTEGMLLFAASGNEVFRFTADGLLQAASTATAELVLDASGGAHGKKWATRATQDTGGPMLIEADDDEIFRFSATGAFTATSSGTAEIVLDASPGLFGNKWALRSTSTGKLTAEVGGVETLRVVSTGALSMLAPEDEDAQVTLDATETVDGKTWAIKSSGSSGTEGWMLIVNESDSVTISITDVGSIYAAQFVGGTTVTAAPGFGEGLPGAMVVDSSNECIWIKTDSVTWVRVG